MCLALRIFGEYGGCCLLVAHLAILSLVAAERSVYSQRSHMVIDEFLLDHRSREGTLPPLRVLLFFECFFSEAR